VSLLSASKRRCLAHAAGAFVICCALATPSAAHHVWIEQEADGKYRLYFGEFAENLKEVAGKLLDRVEPAVRLQSSSGENPVQTKRRTDGIDLLANLGTGESFIAEDIRYPVSERKVGERTVRSAYQPAARFVPDLGVRKPVLTLDVLPSDKTGRFKVEFRNAALPKAKVNVIAVSGWSRELRTGEDGTFDISLPWKGVYAIEVSHTDRVPRQIDGVSIDQTSFVTTLSFTQANGLESLPRPPSAKPSD